MRGGLPAFLIAASAVAAIAPGSAAAKPEQAGTPARQGTTPDERAAATDSIGSDSAGGGAFSGFGEISVLDLEELLSGRLVTSASRVVERLEDAPASVRVFTREQIRRWGYRSLGELLEHTVGFYVTDDHAIPNVSVRGVSGGLRAESGLVNVMIDGRPIAFRPTGGNWIGDELVPLTAIERIEIVTGPVSTVYGADAFLGVINVITRTGESLGGAELRVGSTYAGGPGGDIDLAAGGRLGKLDALVSFRLVRVERSGLGLPTSSPAPTFLDGPESSTSATLLQDSAAAFARLGYRFGDRATLTLRGDASAIERTADFADWLQLSNGSDAEGRDRGNRFSLARGFLDATLEVTASDELSLAANATFFAGEPTSRDRIDIGSDFFHVRRLMDSRGGQFGLSNTWQPAQQLQIITGADFIYDHQRAPGVVRVPWAGTAASPEGTARNFYNLGVYALGRCRLGEVLSLNAGLRLDYHNIYARKVNGRVGGTLHPTRQIAVKLYYGSAYRAPTAQLLYGVPLFAGDVLGNASLRPQHIHSAESQVSYQPWDWLRLQSGFTYSYLQNKAEFTLVGFNQVARNVAKLNVFSFEAEARVDWKDRVWGYAGFGLVGGERRANEEGYRAEVLGTRLEAYPTSLLNAGLMGLLPTVPVRLGSEVRVLSARRASSSNVLENAGRYSLPAAAYLDLSAALADVEVLRGRPSSLLFQVRNVLDSRSAHPGFGGIDYPSASRLFLLQLQQRL